MSPVFALVFLTLCGIALTQEKRIHPKYLEWLRQTGQDEEFAKIMRLKVEWVRPQKVQQEHEFLEDSVSALGDIVLSPEQEEQARQGLIFANSPEKKWQNNRIPYVILSNEFTQYEELQINKGIAAFNNKTKALKIIPLTGEQDYVALFKGSGCYALLGRQGNVQPLSLINSHCFQEGVVQHEFMHAAGFLHEHSRPDRDEYIRLVKEAIPNETLSQFDKMNPNVHGIQGEYDYYSILHYSNRPMRLGLKKPFEVLKPNVNESKIGQRVGLTPTDILKINVLYP